MATRRSFLKIAAGVAALANVDLLIDEQTDEIWIRKKIRSLGSDEDSVTVERRVPASLDDPHWFELVDNEEQIHQMALQSFIINAQAAARRQMRDGGGEEEIQAAFEHYTYPSRPRSQRLGRGLRPISELPETLVGELTQEQLAFLAKHGLKV